MRAIRTERLILRDFAEGDWPAVDAMLSDAEATRHMHFAAWSAAQRRDWFSWCLANARDVTSDTYNWAIALAGTGEAIGWLGIGCASHPDVAGERSFGYILARAFWGRGYMTEALRAALAYEFDVLGTPCVTATCETANAASARVMEKAGMRFVKTVYDADFEGNWAERHHYAIRSPQR